MTTDPDADEAERAERFAAMEEEEDDDLHEDCDNEIDRLTAQVAALTHERDLFQQENHRLLGEEVVRMHTVAALEQEAGRLRVALERIRDWTAGDPGDPPLGIAWAALAAGPVKGEGAPCG